MRPGLSVPSDDRNIPSKLTDWNNFQSVMIPNDASRAMVSQRAAAASVRTVLSPELAAEREKYELSVNGSQFISRDFVFEY
jgi:hypothetical protein